MSGKQFLAVGTALTGVKYVLDCTISGVFFHRPWIFSEYFAPGLATGASPISAADASYYAGMLIASLPFAFIGSAVTMKRLKTLGLPPWLVILFFVPFVNMIFFIILAVIESGPNKGIGANAIPSGSPAPGTQSAPAAISGPVEAPATPAAPVTPATPADRSAPADPPALLDDGVYPISARQMVDLHQSSSLSRPHSPPAVPSNEKLTRPKNVPAMSSPDFPGQTTAVRLMDKMPEDGAKAFFVAALLPVPISVLAAIFSVTVLGVYGWSVFTAVPFVAGIAAPILYGWQKRRGLAECLANSIVCLMLMASVLLLIPFEGIICLMMASPLAVGIGLVGGLVGYAVQANLPRNETVPKLLGCFALFVPLLMLGEFEWPNTYPVYENVSSIEIAAPPQLVWRYLIDFPPLPPPSELVFKTGVAYPIQAKISGRGPGAVRQCIFTTGKFIEPIQIWDEPRLLRFGVLAQPHPMRELSLYPDLNPPHLDHYLVAKQGQFLLTPTSGNHTLLQGTTWYQNYMGPRGYWRIWSDWIIHCIHMRVLNHVKNLSEQDYARSQNSDKL